MDISVIIPTYNRSEKLKKCIDSILVQDFSKKKYEIIVVDDCSNDNSINILKDFELQNQNLKYKVLSKRKGPGNARNLGVEFSSGDILVFTDSDCILDKNYLNTVLELHNKNRDCSVIGGYTYTNSFNLKSQIIQFMSNSAIFNKICKKKEIIFFPTCNVSFKKNVFISKKFDKIFQYPGGEDLEFFWRLYKAGYKFLYSNKFRVYHNQDVTFKQFMYRPFLYGKENFIVKKIHNDHPALRDLNTDNIIKYLYSVIKEIIRSPFLSISLAKKFNNEKNGKSHLVLFISMFYFFLFRIIYLFGNLVQTIKYLLHATF